MSSFWQETTIGALCDQSGGDVQTGPFGSQLHSNDYVEDGTPVVMPADIDDGRIRTGDIARIDQNDWERLSKYHLESGDIVFARRGDLSRIALVAEREAGWLCGTGCIRVRLASGQVDERYIYHHLRRKHTEEYLLSNAVGSTMANLNTDIIRSVPLRLPPPPIQRRIADILGALDDKIALNRQMNETLEAMAQTLYRHWFVDFGPFQDQPFVDSELGPIPERWGVKTIGDVAKMRGGSTPKTSVDEYWEGGDITWFTPTDLTSSGRLYITESDRQITEEGLNSCSTNYVPPYSLMMTSRATVGVVAFNRVRACTNQGFINVMPKDEVSRFQVYFWIDQMMPEIMARADGSTYPEISQRDFKPLPIVVAPPEVNEQFIEKTEPLFDLIESNTIESDSLADTRDYLLPKLISGEIEVEAAEERVGSAAA